MAQKLVGGGGGGGNKRGILDKWGKLKHKIDISVPRKPFKQHYEFQFKFG